MKRIFVVAWRMLGIAGFAAGSVPGWTQAAAAARGAGPKDVPPSGWTKTIVLWPGGAPLSIGATEDDVPKLYYYPAAGSGVRSAVVVLPGGGFTHVVNEKEGAVPARWLAAHGVAAFVLTYRLSPRYGFPAPMLDGERALRYVRSHAAEYGVEANKVGVFGFSAGGLLAGYLATEAEKRDAKSADPVDRVSAHPDFAIYAYGRLSLDNAIPRANNQEALFGNSVTSEMLNGISADRHVTKETSPSFIYSTTADQTVNSMVATAYYDAMKRMGVPVELHIFEQGPHGTGMGQDLKGMAELQVWPTLLQHWMQLHGWMAGEE
jgi:acetyl esterase/lipase